VASSNDNNLDEVVTSEEEDAVETESASDDDCDDFLYDLPQSSGSAEAVDQYRSKGGKVLGME